ncbi:MAG: hypothetical protein E7462_03975 [Ruminococcaceae bacterium]|nr:hypothetical protein [Oscillospiraceae bacterium]
MLIFDPKEKLKADRESLLEQLEQLNAKEPADMDSELYEAWADQHEELEDLLDEIQDLLDDME